MKRFTNRLQFTAWRPIAAFSLKSGMTAVNSQLSIESRSNTSAYFVRRSLLIRLPSPLSRSGSTPHRTCSAPVATVAASRAISTRQVQSDWHVLPDGTKLEVLKQTCDPVRHLLGDLLHMQNFVSGLLHPFHNIQVASLTKPPLLMLHGAGHAAWCYKVGLGNMRVLISLGSRQWLSSQS